MTRTWEFEWVDDWSTIWSEPFLKQWRELLDSAPDPHVFFEPALAKAWLEVFNEIQDMSPRFLLATDREGRRALFPLVSVRSRWKDMWRRAISPVGQPGFDYRDPIFSSALDAHTWACFWTEFDDELARRWRGTFDIAAIYQLRAADWMSWPVVKTSHAIVAPGPDDVAPRIQLSGFNTFEDYLATRHPRFRRNVQYGIRRLRDRGELTYRVFSGLDVDCVLADLQALLQVNRRRWPMTWRAKGYYESLVRHGMPNGLVHYSRLELDGEPISWHLGFNYRGALLWYLPTFRDEFRAFSPGRMHIALAIENSIRERLPILDFTIGGEPYKYEWSNTTVQLYAFNVFGTGPLSKMRNMWSSRGKRYLVRARRVLSVRLNARLAQRSAVSGLAGGPS